MTALDWTSDDEFVLGGTRYVCLPLPSPDKRSAPDRFYIIKPRSAVERYERLVRRLAPKHMVELGIWDGGSTAFFAQLAQPRKLAAMDRMRGPCVALEAFVEKQDLRDSILVFYGVDQNDPGRMSEILDQQFGDELLDLVIDDASHLVDETRRSFNVLFPRLAAGGSYVIEDWSWAHYEGPLRYGERFRNAPLSVLVFELMLVSAHHPEVIDQIVLEPDWALVRRGPGTIDPDSFDVSASYGELSRELMANLSRDRPGDGRGDQ